VRGWIRLPGLIHQYLREELIRQGLVSSEDLQIVSADSDGPALLCFSSPVCGDLLYRGRKVGGSALRVWRDGLLLQGTIQGLPVGDGHLKQSLISSVGRAFFFREENVGRISLKEYNPADGSTEDFASYIDSCILSVEKPINEAQRILFNWMSSIPETDSPNLGT
jgi:hypothetical protein